MTTEEALLQAVCASPDDDAPRLIYADWLEERGGKPGAARAEFIRLSCQLARLPAQDPGRSRLQSRQRQLLDAHCKKWARPFIGKVLSFEFLRGFVERIETDGKAFLRNAAKWLSLSPLRHIAVRDVGPFAVPLLDSANRQHIVKSEGAFFRHPITGLSVCGNRQRPRDQVSVSRSTACRASASGRGR